MKSRTGGRGRRAALMVVLALLSSACAAAGGSDGTLRIALLLPESKTGRYETHDRPAFEARVHEICDRCETLYANANQGASRQLSQAEAALTNGADVLVLDPVDSVAAGAIARLAARADVPVVTYDRLVLDAPIDFHVTFDNELVGELQAQALLEAIAPDRATDAGIVMLNGAPTDDNARHFRSSAHRVLEGAGVPILAEYDIEDWSPDKAQDRMEQALAAIGPRRIVGVYAANDGMAGGAIAAMKAAGLRRLPPVTGQDAELSAIQRILVGDQHMTVYKSITAEAENAADVAVALAAGSGLPTEDVTEIDNGWGPVPTIVLLPSAVTRNTITDVVADGYWTLGDICVGRFKTACERSGLT
jgi:D-xylose transport system substrate-binding protein